MTAPATQAPRFDELDALRGLAALGVLTFHLYLFWKWLDPVVPGWAALAFDWSPLHIALTGKTTVFFFVLSGFVLAHPYFHGSPPAYISFVIKRFIRIYVPYLVSLGLALCLLAAATAAAGQAPPAKAFAAMWAVPVSWELFAQHVLLIGDYNVHAINAVIWSLVHEMRVSLLIPLIVWGALRFSWRTNLAVGGALAVAGSVLHVLFHSPHLALYKTLPVLLMFIVGALIARHRAAMVAWFRGLSRPKRLGFALAALTLYTYAGVLVRDGAGLLQASGVWKLPFPAHWLVLPADWATVAGVAGLIVTALGSQRAGAWLRLTPLRRLAEIPYGIYLYHLPLLYFLYYMAGRHWPLWAIYALTLVLTYALACLSRQVVELPAARLAHSVATRCRQLGRPARLVER